MPESAVKAQNPAKRAELSKKSNACIGSMKPSKQTPQQVVSDILAQAFTPKQIPITPLKVRQKRTAELILMGKDRKTIARELGIKGNYPLQNVSNRVMAKGVRQAIQDAMEPRKAILERILTKFVKQIEGKDVDALKSNATKVLELALREQAMLTDKTINENAEKLPDLSKIPREELEKAFLSHLELSSRGVDTQALVSVSHSKEA